MNITCPRQTILLLLTLVAACSQQTDSPNTHIVASGMGPHLALSTDGSAIVSYIAPTESGNALRYQVFEDGQWSEARTVSQGDDWFVNWADFPSVVPVTEALWAAHWLVRREAGGYAYDVYAAVSESAGQTWGEPFLLNSDGTNSEHGFVTLFAAQEGIGAVWLDGRNTVASVDHEETHSLGGMSLRAGLFDAAGIVSNEQVIDGLTCDCCQTDIALTNEGPVAVYRNRTTEEVRDIYISRFVNGAWQEGYSVHDDGWTFPGCPVNGPAANADGATLAVAWFTSAGNAPSVKVAWSHDSGRTFRPAIVIAEDGAIGYVGVTLTAAESAIASWLCKGASSHNAICYRNVSSNGELGPVQRLETKSVVARMSVPQLARVGDQLLFVWTEKMDDQFQINSAMVPL